MYCVKEDDLYPHGAGVAWTCVVAGGQRLLLARPGLTQSQGDSLLLGVQRTQCSRDASAEFGTPRTRLRFQSDRLLLGVKRTQC